MNLFYTHVLNKFPLRNIRFAYAYGSGVFEQLNNKTIDQQMIDFVFVVDDSVRFHTENLQQNSSHYSFLKWLGPKFITKIQNDISAAVYFNTLVPLKIDNQMHLIKYGVISEKALIRDLFDWDYLYMAGRLQKPVKLIKTKEEYKLNELSKFSVDKKNVRFGITDEFKECASYCSASHA